MPNYSSITIIGHLGRDPELQYNDNGNARCKFSVAVTRRSGQEETTAWYNCTAWGKLAEVCNLYLKKGSPVMIAGDFSPREYQAKDGATRTSLDIQVRDMQMLGGRDDAQQPSSAPSSAPDTGDIPW